MQETEMEAAVEAGNWEAACCAVERNAGAPGPDGMRTNELRDHLAKHGAGIKAKLLKGSYQPRAARRKEIPKPNGGMLRMLMIDVRNAIANILDPYTLENVVEVTLRKQEQCAASGKKTATKKPTSRHADPSDGFLAVLLDSVA